MRDKTDLRHYYLILGSVSVVWLVLIARLLDLTWIRGNYFTNLATENKIREELILPLRGKIVDKKGRILAQSFYRSDIGGEPTLAAEFKGELWAGLGSEPQLVRKYDYAEKTAHLLGYVSEIAGQEAGKEHCGSVAKAGELRGWGGVEEELDCQLRGKEGKRLVEVNARGEFVREMGRVPPQNGADIMLSIDAYWQAKLYELFEGRNGAGVVVNVKTGELLALVSSPAFDPNAFSFVRDAGRIGVWLEDNSGFPFLNRAIAAQYHPGSVFKPVVAMAGLEEGKLTASTLIEDVGVIRIGEYSYTNWLWNKRGGTDGWVDIVKALKRSNDIFFYKAGEMTGVENIEKWAKALGLGKITGVELPGEEAGIVPGPEWKERVKGEKWYLGNTYHLAIGQGDLEVTPLQVALYTATIARDGELCVPTIMGNSVNKRERCKDMEIDGVNINLIQEGMREACREGGTAWPLVNLDPPLACKTGTAEVGDGSKDTHAWLTAYGPVEDPEVAITVVLERAGEGSDVAAPIVGQWWSEYSKQ